MQPSTEHYLSFYTPLNIDQQIIIRKPYTEGRLGRVIAYAREKDVLCDVLNNKEAVMMATTTIYGVCVVKPFLVKSILGQQNSKNVKSPYSPSIKATLVAFCAFQSVSILYNLKEIQSSPAYQTWKKNRIHMIKDASIITFLEKDDILRHLLCPISGTIPEIPATIESCKHAYDYDAAVAWIDKNPEKPLPGFFKVITKEELIFDFPHINSIIKRLEAINSIIFKKTGDKISEILCVKTAIHPGTSPYGVLIPPRPLIGESNVSTEEFSNNSTIKCAKNSPNVVNLTNSELYGCDPSELLGANTKLEDEYIDYLNNFFFVTRLIVDTKTATLVELFSGCMTSFKDSLIFLDNIQSVCLTKKFKARGINYQKTQDVQIPISQMPTNTSEQKQFKMKAQKGLEAKLQLCKLVTEKTLVDQSIIACVKSWFGYENISSSYTLSREVVYAQGENMELLWK